MKKYFRISLILLGLLATPAIGTAQAQFATQFDQSGARETRENGEKVKLAKILAELKQTFEGYHTNVELFSTPAGGLEYRINWVSGDGRVLFVRVDAQTGKRVSVEGAE